MIHSAVLVPVTVCHSVARIASNTPSACLLTQCAIASAMPQIGHLHLLNTTCRCIAPNSRWSLISVTSNCAALPEHQMQHKIRFPETTLL